MCFLFALHIIFICYFLLVEGGSLGPTCDIRNIKLTRSSTYSPEDLQAAEPRNVTHHPVSLSFLNIACEERNRAGSYVWPVGMIEPGVEGSLVEF